MRADAFFLLENADDQAYEHHKRENKIDVHKLLDRTKVSWERIETDLWKPAAVGATLRKIVTEHGIEELLVNASVGPNTVTVGATLASLFSPIRLYHPAGRKPSEPLQSIEEVAYLPSLRVQGWTPAHVALLESLVGLGGFATGEALKERLRKKHPAVISKGDRNGNWAQREHARFQPLVEFLVGAGALDVEKEKRRWTITVTETGRSMAVLLA